MKGKQKGEYNMRRGFGGGMFFGVFGGIIGSILSLLWFFLGILFAESIRKDILTNRAKRNKEWKFEEELEKERERYGEEGC